MNIHSLQSALVGLPVPNIRYFDTIGSTNDEALAWTVAGAEDGCLVLADQQTQGRGRFNRRWVTRPGAALAFSLILHPTTEEMPALGFFSPLGALAISQALEEQLGLRPQIKWPNDVLLNRKKAAGILVETAWMGDQMQGMVIGIGLNILAAGVPPAGELLFPATSVEEALGKVADREDLLRAILAALFGWRARLRDKSFRQAWEDRLAFRGEWVRIEASGSDQPREANEEPVSGQVMGIDPTGNLRLRNAAGETLTVAVGDVHLRLID